MNLKLPIGNVGATSLAPTTASDHKLSRLRSRKETARVFLFHGPSSTSATFCGEVPLLASHVSKLHAWYTIDT